METFIIGVISALAASGLFAISGWLISTRIRKKIIHSLAHITGSDVEEVFPSQGAANSALFQELKCAKRIDIFAGRGYELLRETFRPLWDTTTRCCESVRILLPDPDKTSEGSWFADREAEVAKYDSAYARGLLEQQVRSNLAFLLNQADRVPDIRVRVYDFPHLGRIIVTDRAAFLTPYKPTAHGRDSPTLLIRPPGPLYEFCNRIFQKAWLSSSEARVHIDEAQTKK